MTATQWLTTPSGRHPYMSHWSRNEPAVYMTYLRKSDHWSKLKHKAAILTLKHSDSDTGVSFWTDTEPYEEMRRSRSQLLQREHQQNHTRLTSIGNKTFTETMVQSLNGIRPGHHKPDRYSNQNVLRSSANDRAREGFRYWVLEKPVFKGGTYTTGARTSFLGLGKSFYP